MSFYLFWDTLYISLTRKKIFKIRAFFIYFEVIDFFNFIQIFIEFIRYFGNALYIIFINIIILSVKPCGENYRQKSWQIFILSVL